MKMTVKTALAASTVLGAIALSTAAESAPVPQPNGSEKCYGVAKAGKNDCAVGIHSCAGQSTKSMDKASFVYLPNGECSKLAGGSLVATK